MGVCVNPAAHNIDTLGVKRFAPECLRFDSKITEKVRVSFVNNYLDIQCYFYNNSYINNSIINNSYINNSYINNSNINNGGLSLFRWTFSVLLFVSMSS